MDEFNVNINIVFTDAAAARAAEHKLAASQIKLPGGAPLPMIGDEVGFIVDGEVVNFRVSARQFLMQDVLPQLDLIVSLDAP